MSARIAFIDHYDSFSCNVMAWLEKNPDLEVERFFADNIPIAEIRAARLPLVFSPGPGEPTDYAQSLKLMTSSLDQVPILGMCLGHQMLGYLNGFKVSRSLLTWHGRAREVSIGDHAGIFRGLPSIMAMATYNSLCLQSGSQDSTWKVSAHNQGGEIEAIERWQNPLAPAIGLQFHPESFLSQEADCLLSNWSAIVRPNPSNADSLHS